MRYNAYLKEETDIFKNKWIGLLEEYDHKKGIKWTLQSILDSISIKSPLWWQRLEIILLTGAN
jgi:hypothetical protein